MRLSTLDALLRRLAPTHVTAAKVDVEGFECELFRGGQELFRLRPRILLTEWKERKVAECALDEAKRHGYRWGRPWGLDRNVLLWT